MLLTGYVFYLLVMDIHIGHHKVILLCFVYEEVFYGQAKIKGACRSRNVFANARRVNEL